MEPVIKSDPEIMHGTPCFVGTRIPAQTFFDLLQDACSIDDFLADFPTGKREQLIETVRQAGALAIQEAVISNC